MPILANAKACRDGYCYETHVAERIFHSMLAGEQQRIQIRPEHEFKSAVVEDGRLVDVNRVDRSRREQLVRCNAEVFIDATYEVRETALHHCSRID